MAPPEEAACWAARAVGVKAVATTVEAVAGAAGARAVRWAVGLVEVERWGGEEMRVAGERGLGSEEGAGAMAATAAMAVVRAAAVAG